jgi:myosin heavy subunit
MTAAGFMLLVIAVAGCESSATKQKLAQLEAVSAEKDSLLAMVSDNARLMSDISATLAKVRDVKKPIKAVASPESPLAASVDQRDSLKTKVTDVVERLKQAETRLAASQKRIATLGGMSDSLKGQMAMMEQSMADLRASMETQRMTISQLTEETNGLKEQNTQLTERTVALTDTVSRMDTERNTVYYVVGTKEDLKKRGVVVEEGSKFLIFGAKRVTPARDLSPGQFTAIDQRHVSEIPLPNPDRAYKIVSRQNLAAVGTEMKNGEVRGANLKITEPERFWGPSRYLIIIEG